MATSRKQYEVALKQAEAELASHQKRGSTLQAAVDALRELLASAPAPARRKPPTRRKPVKRKPAKRKARKPKAAAKPKAKATVMRKGRKRASRAGAEHPQVASGHYAGLGPTLAYDKFVKEFGDSYTVPQIRDTLIMGGVKSTSRTSLSTGIYSVRRRRGLAPAKSARKSTKKPAAKAAKKAKAPAASGDKAKS